MTPDSHLHDRTPPDELLARHLSGEASNVEREWVERWVSLDPARGRMLRAMAEAWGVPGRALEQWEAGAMRARFHTRLAAQRRPASPHFSDGARSPLRWAAVAGVALAAGLALWRWPGPEAAGAGAVVATDSSHFSTRRGQRATITLGDGSTVTLGADSRLSLAPGFGRGERTAVLHGEAFFEVVHDATRPFVVRTPSSVTHVVGTAFGVRQYAGEPVARIAVASGRVAIGATGPTTLLGVGDVGRVTAGGETTVRRDPLAVSALTAWKDGWFTLVDAPMDEAAAALSRWYDIDVRIPAAPLRRRRISVSFRDETPTAALHSIADAIDARVDWDGRTATFISR